MEDEDEDEDEERDSEEERDRLEMEIKKGKYVVAHSQLEDGTDVLTLVRITSTKTMVRRVRGS
jgi:hypothetical protein